MSETNINYLVSLIFTTSRLFREQTFGAKKIKPLPFLRLKALHFIMNNPSSSTKGMAAHLNITAPSATPLVDGLAISGFVKRIFDENDRRITRLAITAKGKNELQNGIKQFTARITKILSKLNDEEINNFIIILEKISNAYKQ